MIQVKQTLAIVDGTSFHEICSFETNNYIGIYVDTIPNCNYSGYIILPKNDLVFSIDYIEEIEDEDLEHLDATVFYKTEEHITSVSTSRCLDIRVDED